MSTTFSQCSKCQALNKLSSQKALEKTPVCGKCGENLSMHGLVSDINSQNFKKIISMSESPVVVDFWASWCGPCRAYGPEYEKASLQNHNAVFLKVNTEVEQQISAEYGIRGIPCTIIFKNGVEVKRQSGAMSAAQLGQLIK